MSLISCNYSQYPQGSSTSIVQYSELVKDQIQQKGHLYFGVLQRLFFLYALFPLRYVQHQILMPFVHGMMYQKRQL